MTDPVNVDNFVFNFEAEHIFADALWRDNDIRPFLESMGYQKNALGNLLAEYADADTVAKIQQMSGNEPLKAVLLNSESGAGIVRHKGNASGGSQIGKNAFLRGEIDSIRLSGATDEAKRIALDSLFDWTQKLAKGEILGADGKPLGVMGNGEFAETLTDVYRGEGGGESSQRAYVDPLAIDNYATLSTSERAEVDRARATSQAVAEYWDDPANSS